jgi:hypothetical protein
MADDHDCGPPRKEAKYTLRDQKHGKVQLRMYDRIGVDDIVLHLVERNLYRLAGGPDPGIDVNQSAVDFVVRERFLQR